MSAYVDIHAHILPGIDDGPVDLRQSLSMARAAAETGIATIVATPHLRSDFPDVHIDELKDLCQSLQAAIEEQQIAIRVVPGAETSLSWALQASDEELALASYGQGGKDLLVETPSGVTAGIGWAIYELRAKGYRITLAHPERSAEFQQNYGAIRELVDQGVLLQVNAESLLGSAGGSRLRRLSRTLMLDGVVHAVASDGHRAHDWRPVTRLAEAVAVASELVGPERARWVAATAPAEIVKGGVLPEPPPVIPKYQRRRLFDRWR